MNCEFCIGVDLCGLEYENYECRIQSAQGDTKCCECGALISAGEHMEFAHGELDNGDINEHHTCLVCAEIAEAFCCEGRCHESLWGDLEQTFGEGFTLNTACFQKLKTATAKKALQEFWLKCVGLDSYA